MPNPNDRLPINFHLNVFIHYRSKKNRKSAQVGNVLKLHSITSITWITKQIVLYFLVLDASGKITDGMLSGHMKFIGNMNECINIYEPNPGNNTGPLR